jgi:hypothetical protein
MELIMTSKSHDIYNYDSEKKLWHWREDTCEKLKLVRNKKKINIFLRLCTPNLVFSFITYSDHEC